MSELRDEINPMVGGAMGGGGGASKSTSPVIQPDSIRSTAIIEVVEAICEGEIEGFADVDPLKCVYLDDTPMRSAAGVDNFSGALVDYRLGTQSQTYMPGSIDDASSSVVNVGVVVKNQIPVTRDITDALVDAIRVTVKFSGLYSSDAKSGNRSGVGVNLTIEVQLDGNGTWHPIDLSGRGSIFDKTESPYQRSFHVNLKAVGQATTYSVRVSRVSADPTEGQISEFQWETYSKLTYAKLRYPNTAVARSTFDTKYFSSIPKRGYLLKGLKVLVPGPSVYNAAARVYTGNDWDGNFVVAWTTNPAWIFYDLITNPRYGLGDMINPAYQNKWSLFQIAKRCDELIPDGFGGQEHRYSVTLFMQSDNDAKKVIMDLASAFDAMSYWSAGAIVATQDAPKSTTALFTPANVVGGRFAYTGSARQVRYTVALVQWNDPSDNYRIATEYVEDREGILRYGYREKQVAAIGCTSRGQAHRYGKRILLTSRLETQSIAFSLGINGLSNVPGNIIRIADPLKAEGERYGGRVKIGTTTSVVGLDAAVTLKPGIAYKIAVIDATGKVVESPVTNQSGVTDSITVSPAFAVAPEANAVFIIYDQNQPKKLYRITGVKEADNAEDRMYNVTAITYAPEKFEQIDSLAALPPLPDNPFINNGVTPPSGLLVNTGVYTSIEGIRRYIDLSWSASTDKFLKNYHLVARHEGVIAADVDVYGQSYRILEPKVGNWEFTLIAVSVLGKASTSITVQYELGEIYLVESVSITDLVLIGGGTNYSGRSPEFDWDTDALTVLGFSDTYGGGQGGQSPWFRDYQVDIYNGATLVRSDFVTESKYIYTYDKNVEDGGPRRTITVRVRARDLYGRYSQANQITVSNPAPLPISTVDIFAGYKSLILSYIRPPDNDWVGVVVFLSTTAGFTPSSLDMIYVGSDTTITIPNLAENVQYFIRVASYDAFGGEDSYTLSATEYTKTISSINIPDPAAIKQGLQDALNDPAATPLVFDADVFAINLNGTSKPVFIAGVHNGSPAILMDADVVVTGDLSADQLIGGRIAATEDIIVGDGSARINGDGSIIVYKGADTINNRDMAILSAGGMSFQRYRGGAYFEYKSVKRVEYGQALSGSKVELPGYWDAQPKIIVSPASLRSYDATYKDSSQTWMVRADNLVEIPAVGTTLIDTQLFLGLLGNATLGGDTVSKTSGADAWDQQGYSSIGTDADCWVSFKFNANNKYAMGALNTDPQSNASYNSLDFAIHANSSGIIEIYHGVNLQGTFGAYTASDVFRIERSGTSIFYKKNGTTFFTTTVAPGAILYFDSSVYSLGGGLNSIQFWHKTAPANLGSGRWTFDAVAMLNYASSAGNNTVASNSGALSNVNAWTSGESVLPNSTVSITVSAKFSSVRGNGASTYGYLYRSVTWTIKGWDGSAWINLAVKTRNIAAAEHGQQITDTNPVNIAANISKIKVDFIAYDTNGAIYTIAPHADAYGVPYSVGVSGSQSTSASLSLGTPGSSASATLSTNSYSPPSGSKILSVAYSVNYANYATDSVGNGGAVTHVIRGGGVVILNTLHPNEWNFDGNQTYRYIPELITGSLNTGAIATPVFNANFWAAYVDYNTGWTPTGGSAYTALSNPSAVVSVVNRINNSSNSSNNFTLQDYAWNTAGLTSIATGSLNWLATGD